ncbi:MAG: hypothetical protein SF028_10975 [Candidatus Sumerlaeia bacterium]|nr:hypothetical protein [Candidatus Sumerlaeia bacterium]
MRTRLIVATVFTALAAAHAAAAIHEFKFNGSGGNPHASAEVRIVGVRSWETKHSASWEVLYEGWLDETGVLRIDDSVWREKGFYTGLKGEESLAPGAEQKGLISVDVRFPGDGPRVWQRVAGQHAVDAEGFRLSNPAAGLEDTVSFKVRFAPEEGGAPLGTVVFAAQVYRTSGNQNHSSRNSNPASLLLVVEDGLAHFTVPKSDFPPGAKEGGEELVHELGVRALEGGGDRTSGQVGLDLKPGEEKVITLSEP